jgi:hypothetical protein
VENKINQLFDGSIVMVTKQKPDCKYTLALVLRTGFYSSKGQQMRNIIFPKYISNSFSIAYFKTLMLFFKSGMFFLCY